MAAIKKIILLTLTALMMVGCESEETERLKGFNLTVVDSCEYLIGGEQGYGFFAHKGNCRFCKERRQNELEELVIKLKEK